MAQYLHLIEEFSSKIREHLTVQAIQFYESHVIFQLEKLWVVIYLPNNFRMDFVTDRQVIHVDIDQLIQDTPKIISRLKGLHGIGSRIYARNTVVARLDKRVAIDFLKEHHMQIPLPGKYRYGLFYQGELVSIAVFSGGRIMKDIAADYRSFELIRFCHKADANVIGGISKLIKAFVADFHPQDIMTYADKDWSTDSSLKKIGFQEVGELAPIRFLVRGGKRIYQPEEVFDTDYFVENKGSIKLKLVL